MADTWFGPDKAKHFGVCFAVSVAGAGLAWLLRAPTDVVWGIGFTFAVLAGVGKEWYDDVWSWRDIAWDAVGGAVGATVMAVIREAVRRWTGS